MGALSDDRRQRLSAPSVDRLDVGSTARSFVKPLALVAFVGVLAYFVLGPLVRLQSKAFADGAAGYRTAFTADRIGRTIAYTVGLALGSLAIALVLGTLLAWAATRLPPKLRILRVIPVLPIVVPAIASVVGWAFLLSPRPGYLNAALRGSRGGRTSRRGRSTSTRCRGSSSSPGSG